MLTPDKIKQLQIDLCHLGFLLAKKIDGIYGLQTSLAVREFQIYATMPFIKLADKPIAIKNNKLYTGAISGEINAETLQLIQYWKEQHWYCPVVITRKQNTLYAQDFSGYYQPVKTNLIKIGQHIFDPARNFNGPVTLLSQYTPQTEMTPDNLMGKPLSALNPAELSTYKVIRAVSEVECLGHFDCINAYDNGFISMGPCHWTLGITPPMSEGELCAYFAYLAYRDPAAYQKALGNFGIEINKTWSNNKLFNSSQRKYTAWFKNFPLEESIGNYFRTWHWFYRFLMAARTIQGFRQRMWDMACIRLRDILSTPHPIASQYYGKDLTIGDIYTSEKSVAMLMRWHVRFPNDVISKGVAGIKLQNAFSDREENLIPGLNQAIMLRNNKDLISTINQVMAEKSHLKKEKNSFIFNNIKLLR